MTVRRSATAAVIAVAAVMIFHAAAIAHVALLASQPAANSVLPASPPSLRLEFSEPVEPAVAHLSIVETAGRAIPLTPANDPHDAYVIVATVPTLAPGGYRVQWHVVSEDGHPVGGSFTFTVGSAAIPPPAVPGDPQQTTWGPTLDGAPLIPAMLRGAGVTALAAMSGLLFYLAAFGVRAGSRPARVALWLSLIVPVALGAHLWAWLINASPDHRVSGAWVSSALGTSVGRTELWCALLSLPPLWALGLARRPVAALVLAIPALFASAVAGHAAAFRPAWSIPSKALHIAALSAWLGGLVWLAVRERNDSARYAREASRVSAVALWAVIAIVVSGVLQAALLVPSWAGLRSPYGVVVLAKVAGVCVLVAFGAYHRVRVLPRLGMARHHGETFGASLRAEIAVLVLVALLGGLLSYLSPPASNRAARAIPSGPSS